MTRTIPQVFALIALVACNTSTNSTNRDVDAANPSAIDAAILDQADAAPNSPDSGPEDRVLPTPNASVDYQLGEPYAPPNGVTIVTRDRNASIATGLYNICYINGFQSQPDENDFWLEDHSELILRDGGGGIVIDPDWEEMILDIRTPGKRDALATIMGGWIDGCANDGFDAIEIDNLDTYSRSGGLVAQADAVAYMRLLADAAHARGLPIGQKNSAEVLDQKDAMGTDFAVVEECNRYSECGEFTAVYGNYVIVIEYRRSDFDEGCADFPNLSIVLRDLDLVAPGSSGYMYDGC